MTHTTLSRQFAEWTICVNMAKKLANYMKGSKTWLIIKIYRQHAIKKFQGTDIKITTDGKRYQLHVVVGFVE